MSRFLCSLVLVLVAGCQSEYAGHFQSTRPAPHALSSRAAQDVQLVTADADRPSIAIGTIDEHADAGAPMAALMWKMRERGGAAGCDAVVVRGKASERRHDASGTCLVYVDPAIASSNR